MALLLIIGSFAGTISAQVVVKVGDNPFTINSSAALEVESSTKGFLPPRMTKSQRNTIPDPVAGLQIWCIDCNSATEPASGLPYIYTGTAWATIASSIAKSTLTTGKMGEANAPTWLSVNSATIKGVLVQPSQALPTETGIVWKEIIGNDFDSFPYLDAAGNNTTTVFKTATESPVTMAGGAINMNVTLNPSNSTNPFYFSTYAKTPLGVDYGNPVVFNCADPVITSYIDVVTNGSLMPKFSGTFKVNAGTPKGAVTEYGYYVGTTNPPTSKVSLSTSTSFDALNESLDKEIFTTNPAIINLEENDYLVENLGTYYFQFYAIVSGRIVKSPVENWNALADPVTGGTAVATASIGAKSGTINYGVNIPSTGPNAVFFPVVYTVSKSGTFVANNWNNSRTGTTGGLALSNFDSTDFTKGTVVTLSFNLSGTPATTLDGNVFTMARIPGFFNTGILPTAYAVCNGTMQTEIVEVVGAPAEGIPTIWMDRNLGATHVAESMLDIRAFGCLYQWGRGNDGHASITWKPLGTPVNSPVALIRSTADTPSHGNYIASTPLDWRNPGNDQLWQGVSGINNPCPSGFRLPTMTEFNAQGIYSQTAAYNNVLKIPAAGMRNNSDPAGTNSQVNLWTSTVGTDTYSGFSYYMAFDNSNNSRIEGHRYFGQNVRCIKN